MGLPVPWGSPLGISDCSRQLPPPTPCHPPHSRNLACSRQPDRFDTAQLQLYPAAHLPCLS